MNCGRISGMREEVTDWEAAFFADINCHACKSTAVPTVGTWRVSVIQVVLCSGSFPKV